ncbi:MAG: hypothetical protein DSY81_10735 [Bacillota bacterium]|nr:MAG: hypothetical protein DSY92_01095 [Planctomycetota bacterium]RUA07959.1 MAG: hypothetical protein DSY81_10735 [Bacillota bacterium]HIB86770.1 hypothetical protein [Candidatus Poribacteria bacterium]
MPEIAGCPSLRSTFGFTATRWRSADQDGSRSIAKNCDDRSEEGTSIQLSDRATPGPGVPKKCQFFPEADLLLQAARRRSAF